MNKAIICLTGCILALGTLRARDHYRQTPDSGKRSSDTTGQVMTADSAKPAQDAPQEVKDTMIQVRDTTIRVTDTSIRMKDTTLKIQGVAVRVKGDNIHVKDTANSAVPDSTQSLADAPKNPPATMRVDATPAKDPDAKEGDREESLPAERQVDKRWFISPLLKLQFQDFAMLEKNRKGYLSDANTLPFFKRGNASFAASAYKNLTGRLSFSADIGLSFGHVTNDNVLISQTQSKTYNLLNVALYYHLLSASYRLQPYVTVGINDIINSQSYASAPMGIGAKFNARKIMVQGQITYGLAVNKSISNTTMYGLGVYFPIKNKKQKQLDADDKPPYNRKRKEKETDMNSKNGGNIINNIYITIKVDSLLKSKGLDGRGGNGGNGGNGSNGSNGVNDNDDNSADNSNVGNGSGRHSGKGKKNDAIKSLNLDDFNPNDYKTDTINGEPVIRFVVYFEFNEYSLNSKAFASVDKVIAHLRSKPNLAVEIKGYTDDVGSNDYNNFLSRRRAKMVLEYMNSRGIPSELMKARAYGSDSPVASNTDPNQAWLNRRAEIIVHEK